MRYSVLFVVSLALSMGGNDVAARQQSAAKEHDNQGKQGKEEGRGHDNSSFTRVFDLPAFAQPTARVKAALSKMGRKGGVMDANDDLAAGPIELIVNPALSINNPNSSGHTAGLTFMGQFFDHDMTFDTTSRLGQPTNPHTAPNSRRPYFDLDSVYGDGPTGSPLLYDRNDRARFRVEHGGLFEDLPRDGSSVAIIADPRNDENVILSGLQVSFLLFHNAVVDRVRATEPELDDDEVFDEARRLTTHHYQWLIVNEFLPQFVGQPVVDDVLTHGGRFYAPPVGNGNIPVEFQMAYRFGHSFVRPSYRANFTGNAAGPFFALLFDPNSSSVDPTDLRGGARASRRFVGWHTFFSFPGFEADVRPNKRIDTKLSTPLFELPLGAIAAGTPPTSLAERNLLRHLTWRMPSGQAIAAAMGEPVLPPERFTELQAIYAPFMSSTPLWYYVLREADVLGGGERLGPVGGRLVAEVFIGLLRADPNSIFNQSTAFAPSLGPASGAFTMIDFLKVAGVDQKR